MGPLHSNAAEPGLGQGSPWEAGLPSGLSSVSKFPLSAVVALIVPLAPTSCLVPGLLPDFSFLIGGWL